MAYRLRDRNRQIPNGMLFYQPQTKWRSTPWSSFNSIVDQVIAHRTANSWMGLRTDRPGVEAEVDEFNAAICANIGASDFITAADGGTVPPLPMPLPNLANRLQNVAVGAEILVEWLASGAEAVKPEIAEHRAAVCAECPMNGKGGWERFFTKPVSQAIRSALRTRRDWQLSTSKDQVLGVCEACNCPLPLKVHMPVDRIRAKLLDSQKAALDPRCWIPKE